MTTADAFAFTPIEEVDVLALEPPADLLRKIARLAKAIDALLQADLVAQARALASELRTMIEVARGAGVRHVATQSKLEP